MTCVDVLHYQIEELLLFFFSFVFSYQLLYELMFFASVINSYRFKIVYSVSGKI